MKQIYYIPNNTLEPLTDSNVNRLRRICRFPIALYNAKYFDEPFTIMILSSFGSVSDITVGSHKDDLNHVDFMMTVDDKRYKVDVKTISFNHQLNNSGKFIDYVSIGEKVMAQGDDNLLISVVYKYKIYMTKLSDFRKFMNTLDVQKSSSSTGNVQDIYKYDIKEVMIHSLFTFIIPEDMYTMYEKNISIYHRYHEMLKDFNREEIYTYSNVFENCRLELTQLINETNNLFYQKQMMYVSPVNNSEYADVDLALAELGL